MDRQTAYNSSIKLARTITLAVALAAASMPAFAASTIDTTVPAHAAPFASDPVRQNFVKAASDITALQDRNAGPTQPAGISMFQDWANTVGCPTACTLTVYDGTVPVTWGTINQSTHTFGAALSAASISPTAPITATFASGVATLGIANGVSVANPGTGALEMLLPVQTVSGTSKTFLPADLYKKTRRSNGGVAMSDTFPAASATGLINGTRIVVANVDVTATLTITAGVGTVMASGGSVDTIGPGRDIAYEYDATSTQWRRAYNTGTALLGPNNLSDLSNIPTARAVLGLGSAAQQNIGTSGSTVPLLNGNNTFSGTNVFSGSTTLSGGVNLILAYQGGNPGNAASYQVAPDPPIGFTGVYNALQLDQGGGVTAAQQNGQQGSQPLRQAMVATTVIPATDTSTFGALGIAGYSHSKVSNRVLLGALGQATTEVGNNSLFGLNGVVSNNSGACGSGCTDGNDVNYIAGAELDINLWQKPGGVNPNVVGGHAYGLTIAGSGNNTAQIVGSSAIVVNYMNIANGLPWTNAFQTYDGAAVLGAFYGATGAGNNVNAQAVRFQGRTAGGANRITDIHGDPNGAMIIAPDSNSTIVTHLSGIGGSVLWATGSSFGTAKQNVPTCTAYGMITNDSSGNINCNGPMVAILGVGATPVTLATGEFGLSKISASGVAPGAGAAKLEAVAGTSGGTCKLIMYAGTSATPTTIIDNVGAGC